MKFGVILMLSLLSISNGYKILFLVPFAGPSHWFLMQNFVKELLNRGHEVTAITNTPISNFQSPNYTEILINPPFDLMTVFSQKDVHVATDENDFEKVRANDKYFTKSGNHGLSTPNVQKIINSEDLHFDLVINEEFFHESWLMFGYKFNAPVITICPYAHADFFDRAMGLLTPWSYVPHYFLPHGDDMTYFQRVHNVLVSTYDWWFRNWVMIPKQNEIAQRYFGHLAKPGKPLPHVDELYRNISMILVNVHWSFTKPRPLMPGIVYVGGAHIKAPKPLASDLQDFIDNSEHGVVYFSLGSYLQTSELPMDKINIFLSAISKLKQRVIWKFENESPPFEVPANVLIRKWLPQSDILAHPNIVLFITHGGVSGTYEGTARGVPMLYVPFFGDQKRNALKSVLSGNALMLQFSKLTNESFSSALDEMLSNKVYFNRAKEISRLFNDNLVHPMEEAMFWIEYVIRSKGAAHLKSNASNMSWFSYLLLDILIVPFAIIAIIYFMIKLLLQSSKRDQNNGNKQKNTKRKSKQA